MSSEINICLNCGKIQDYIEYKTDVYLFMINSDSFLQMIIVNV